MFDSGIGGLSVLMPVRRLLPDADLVYVADRGWGPYGERTLEDVRDRAERVTAHLLAAGAAMVVVACHTASAAALADLRAAHPDVPFVGMEPAVKPAAAISHRRRVGVLATEATFQSELFASVVNRHGAEVAVIARACPGWAAAVEAGHLDGPAVEALVGEHLLPLLAHRVDTLVLGCTHYPFLAPMIRRVTGPDVEIIDPADAVARQVARVASGLGPRVGRGRRLRIQTTGKEAGMADLVERLTGWQVEPELVRISPPLGPVPSAP